MLRRPFLLAVLALALAAPSAAAQAPGLVPAGRVIQVQGRPAVTRAEFDHWIRIAALDQVEQTGRPARLPAEGTAAYRALAEQVAQFLISTRWIPGEAARLGVAVSDAAVRASFTRTRAQSFPTRKAFDAFLVSSGMTLDDLFLRIRLDLLSERLRLEVVRAAPAPTRAETRAWFVRNRRRFSGKFAASERSARMELLSVRQQAALERFVRSYRARWTSRTACAIPAIERSTDCGP